MKTTPLILTLSLIALAGFSSRSFADQSVPLSPRAESMRAKAVSGASIARESVKTESTLSPRAASMQRSVSSGAAGGDIDLAHRGSTLSPRAQTLLGDKAKRFEIAPLK